MTPTADQVQQLVQQALRRFEQLVVSDRPTGEVLQSMVQTLAQPTGASGVLAYMPTDRSGQQFMVTARYGDSSPLALDGSGQLTPPVAEAVRSAMQQAKPVVVSPEQESFLGTDLSDATQFYIPIDAVGRVMGAVHLILPGGLDPKVYRQYIAFAQQGARSAGMYLARRQSEVLQQDAASGHTLLKLTRQLLPLEKPVDVIHELANQARPALEAQRVAVIGYPKGKRDPGLVRFSDAVDTNRKAVLVRSVQMLAEAVREREAPMTFTRQQELADEDEPLAPLLEELWNLGNAQAVSLMPLRGEREVVGVMVAEFGRTDQASQKASTQQELCQQTGPILARTIELHRRPLRRTSSLLAKVKDRPVPALVRAVIVAAVVATLVKLLAFTPVPIHVRGDARLEPAQMAVMSAPHAAQVEQVLVETGDEVEEGQLVARMDASDLRLQLAETNKSIEEQWVRLRSARSQNKQSQVRAAQLRIDQLEIRRQRLQRDLEQAEVRSMIAGTVLTEAPRRLEGQTVREGDTLIETADLSEFELVVDLREEDVALVERALSEGREVPLSFLSRPWPNQVQHARITNLKSISPTSAPDQQSQQHLFKVRVAVELEGLSPRLVMANPSGRAKLHVGEGSVLYRYGRRVWHFLRMTLLF